MGLFINVFDLLLIASLQLMLNGLDVINDTVVEEVFEMRQTVEDPECSVVAVGEHVTVTVTVFDGHLTDGAIERRVNRGIGVVDAKPDDAADGVGQPVTALGDEGETRLHHLDAALVEIRLTFIFPIEWVPTER